MTRVLSNPHIDIWGHPLRDVPHEVTSILDLEEWSQLFQLMEKQEFYLN